MIHFVYKTIYKNGRYYIGRHSTENIDDGYLGSGKWIQGIKNKNNLSREIIAWAEDTESLLILEDKHIEEHFDDPLNMNILKSSRGFPAGEEHPFFNNEEIKKKYRKAKQGKSWEEIMGEEKAKDRRKRAEEPRGSYDEEHCKNISVAKKGMPAPHNWNIVSRKKVSDTMTGKIKRSDEFKQNSSKRMKKIVKCPHCDKNGSGISMLRWHFNNCKMKI